MERNTNTSLPFNHHIPSYLFYDSCFAKFYCSAGCSASSLKYEKDLYKPYDIACQMQKKRVECAIAIKAALAE